MEQFQHWDREESESIEEGLRTITALVPRNKSTQTDRNHLNPLHENGDIHTKNCVLLRDDSWDRSPMNLRKDIQTPSIRGAIVIFDRPRDKVSEPGLMMLKSMIPLPFICNSRRCRERDRGNTPENDVADFEVTIRLRNTATKE
jgi:hypothetical protein